MAFLGMGDYLCEACKWFDTDGIDGNHPSCRKQWREPSLAIRLDEVCPFGYEFGVPSGYLVSMERNEKRAYEIRKNYVPLRTCRMDVFAMHDDGTITYQCSECGSGYCDDRPPNYCPNCGAKVVER